MIIIAPCFHDFAHVAFGTCAGTHALVAWQRSASLRYWGINSFTDGSAVTAARDSSCCSDIVRRSLCGRSVQLRCLFVCCDCHLMVIMGCMFLQYSTAALLRACSLDLHSQQHRHHRVLLSAGLSESAFCVHHDSAVAVDIVIIIALCAMCLQLLVNFLCFQRSLRHGPSTLQ
jgi:hypothetical protein